MLDSASLAGLRLVGALLTTYAAGLATAIWVFRKDAKTFLTLVGQSIRERSRKE